MQTDLPLIENVLLKDFCTLGIGGPARYFLEVRTIEQMQKALMWCRKEKISYVIVGKGSNCLFDDSGYSGAVLINKIEFIERPSPGTFHVGAGYSFSLLGVQAARTGWGGLEFASGIPGSIGGAVCMNAGANQTETSQTLASVDFVDQEGALIKIPRSDLAFSYRHSPFQTCGGSIVGATFVLHPKAEARKQQIEIIKKRKETQPYRSQSAGCIFLNPYSKHAGALIEQCGLKGVMVGGAQVSKVHANFLINAGGATCEDMQTLIRLVQQRVREKTGIELASEVRYIQNEMVMT